ncbi:MAG TPA: imidazole glycerol phosphate synthase subunit HisH [Alphaproteobacteria bacterium]|nr:imidazole glycerol phosphate synthase subunit HisH [Alphaproteobacteria bacterium]
MIAIIDYGAGNIHNVRSILEHLKQDVIVTSDPEDLKKADRIVLPGVGAFGYMMKNLSEKGLDKEIHNQVYNNNKPFLGVCLGFQAMFDSSEESPGAKGLGLFKGQVVKFKWGKVPHVGWNNVKNPKLISQDHDQDKFNNGYAYFVHSFYPKPEDKSVILFESDYGETFCSGVAKDNVIGVQFHPERSGKWGIEFYRRWINDELTNKN